LDDFARRMDGSGADIESLGKKGAFSIADSELARVSLLQSYAERFPGGS